MPTSEKRISRVGPARDRARFAVLSFGRSGSTWLARVLTHADEGVAAFHAPIAHIVGRLLLAERTMASPYLNPPRERLTEILRSYTAWVEHRERQYPVLGELHLLYFAAFQELPDLLPPRRALLVRNGIQVVHATTYGWLENGTPRERSWILGALPAIYAQASGEERLFAAVCAYWADHFDICEPLVRGESLRLEDLTRSPAALQAAHARLTGREVGVDWCAAVSNVKANRCVQGDNSPANLFWNVWSETMRGMFVDLCGAAMRRSGYEIPDRSAAPPSADLRPRHPREAVPPPLGPLSPLWCFLSNPLRGPVVVCGEPAYAGAAARLLGPAAWLLEQGPRESSPARGAVNRIALSEVARLRPTGVFIADPAPNRPVYASLRELVPGAEVVEMLPGSVSDEDLQTLESAGPRYAQYDVGARPGDRPDGGGSLRGAGGGASRGADRPVVLVSLPPWGLRVPPLGVGCLAEHLRAHGWPVKVFDANLLLQEAVGARASELWAVADQLHWLEPRYARELAPRIRPRLHDLVDEVLAAEPLILGVSCGTMLSRAVAEDFVGEVRRLSPDAVVIGGGQGVNGVLDRAPFRRDGFDYFVEGEGEQTLLEVVEAVAAGRGSLERLAAIPGVVPWRATTGDPYERFSPRPIEPDLLKLPFPTYQELALERYSHVNLLMSRGCPRKCQFCANPTRLGAYRSLPPQGVFEAMAYHHERGQRTFEFNDVLLNADVSSLERLADLILAAGWRVEWTGAAVARKEMTSELLHKLRRAGVRRLRYGIESFSEEVLRSMKKGRGAADAVDVLRRTREAGIETHIFLIVGFPGETEACFRETLDVVAAQGGPLADSITVSGCMIPDSAPIGYDAQQFGVAKAGPLPLVTWEGADGNTHEERVDRIWRLAGLLGSQGFERLRGEDADDARVVQVCLPDEEDETGPAGRRDRVLAAATALARETGRLGVETDLVDLHEAWQEATRVEDPAGIEQPARAGDARRVSLDLLHGFDEAYPRLPRSIEERLDAILCSRAAYLVLWLNTWQDAGALRFAQAVQRTDPGLCVLVAGAGAPPGGEVPPPLGGVLLGHPSDGLHALIRAHRVGRGERRAMAGVLCLGESFVAPTPWWRRVVEIVAQAEDPGGAAAEDAAQRLTLSLRFARASRPLRFRLELGSRLLDTLADGQVAADLVMPGGRVRAGSRLTLTAWLPPWFAHLPRSWAKLRAYERLPDGREVEVLHSLPVFAGRGVGATPGNLLAAEAQARPASGSAVRAIIASGEASTATPRLELARLEAPDESGPEGRRVESEVRVRWPVCELYWPRQPTRPAAGSEVPVPSSAAGRAASAPGPEPPPTPAAFIGPVTMTAVARRLADNLPLVRNVLERLAVAPRSPLPGWECARFVIGDRPGDPLVRAELTHGAEVVRLELVTGDAPEAAFATGRFVKLRLAPEQEPLPDAWGQALRTLCQLLDHYLHRAGE